MIEVLIEGGIVVAASVIAAIKLREKNRALIDALERVSKQKEADSTSYKLPPQDSQMIEECRRMLKTEFPLGVAETMKHMNLEERKKCMEILTQKAAMIMHVNPVQVTFDEDPYCVGGYNFENDTIVFSVAFLGNDDDLKMSVNTIFHELRHKLQFYSVEKENVMGYHDEVLNKWKSEFYQYIGPHLSIRLYYHQIIETDARKYADEIFKA